MTEDEVRNLAGKILNFENSSTANSGVGQITSFNQLGFTGIKDRPDGWYLPYNFEEPAIILETKSSETNIHKHINELIKNCNIALEKYKKVIGILYNYEDLIVLKNNKKIETTKILQDKNYYISLFNQDKIDKQKIYNLTKKINDCLHIEFGIKNLYHRMIFTACALVAKRYGAHLIVGMNYLTFQASVSSTLKKSLEKTKIKTLKLTYYLMFSMK